MSENENGGSGVSAADIITYAGVPLAVVGILPSLYTFIRSIVTLRDVRRTLTHNGVEAMTRGSMLSGIIEVEMPRKSITPLDRDDPEYFEISAHKSDLKGGTWTMFNWRELVIGMKVLRLQYHDELVVPQAEVELEALVAFLLDRGAEVDQMGWADLRGSGLWTPVGTRLLMAPDGSGKAVLSVAGSEDSEGMLSLKLSWVQDWDVRNIDDLPPYWMSLAGPDEEEEDGPGLGIVEKEKEKEKEPLVKLDEKDEKEGNKENSGEKTEPEVQAKRMSIMSPDGLLQAPSPPPHRHSGHNRKPSQGTIGTNKRDSSRLSFATTALTSHPISSGPLRLKLSPSGVDQILIPDSRIKIRPRHLRQFGASNSPALWFSSAATALGAPQGGLWAFAVPPAISAFTQIDSIPCGVLELWGVLTSDEVPVWRTPFDDSMARLEAQQRERLKRDRMMREAQLKGNDWTKAVHERYAEERRERQFEDERNAVEAQKRGAQEMVEALGSPRVSCRIVGDACRKWLVKEGRVQEEMSVAEVVERVLWEMAVREEVAKEVARMLDTWKHWTDNGGMTKKEYDDTKLQLTTFAYCACIVSLIGESAEALEGSMVSDLQECMRMWKRIRLG